MSRNSRKGSAKEPWEQSIYDTDQKTGRSRSDKRKSKKENTVFLTILVILLLLIIAFPIGTYLFITHDNKPNAKTNTVISSSASESSEDTQLSRSSEVATSGSLSGSSDQVSESSSSSDFSNEGDTFDTVLEGDTLQTIATRNGISLADLYRFNEEIDPTNLQIGQSVRVK